MDKMYKLTGDKAAVLNKYFVNADYKRDTEVKESGLISKFYSDFDGKFIERLKNLASGGVFTDKNISTLKNIFNKLDIKNKPSDTDWDEIANTNKEVIAKGKVIRELFSTDRGDLRKIFKIEVGIQNENTKELTYIKTDSDLKKTIEEYNLELLKSNMSKCCQEYSIVTFKKTVNRIINICNELGIKEDKNPIKKIIGYTSMDIEPKTDAFYRHSVAPDFSVTPINNARQGSNVTQDSNATPDPNATPINNARQGSNVTQDSNATPVDATTSNNMHSITADVLDQFGLSAEPNLYELFPQLQFDQPSYITESNSMESEILTPDRKRKRSPSVSSMPPFKQQKQH